MWLCCLAVWKKLFSCLARHIFFRKGHMGKHTVGDLHQMQSLPLSAKIQMTERRIREWVEYYGTDGTYLGFSGGKDSTVLLDISRKIFPGRLFKNTATHSLERKWPAVYTVRAGI